MAAHPYTLALASALLAQPAAAGTALLPDLVAVTPDHLNIVKKGNGDTVIRFSTGTANLGAGPLELHPINAGTITTAVQWVYDAKGAVVSKTVVGTAAYHPIHKHVHISNFNQYGLRRNSLTGPLVAAGDKLGYCIIDWLKVDENGNGPDAVYWDCESQNAIQGISVGYVDQYHHATSGQELPLPTVPGIYFLINKVNPNGIAGTPQHYLESDYTNNVGWTKFKLEAGGSSWRITILATGGLDAVTTNR